MENSSANINPTIQIKKYKKEIKKRITIPKDLEILARAYPSINGQTENLLIPFKANQIVTEVLSGFTTKNMRKIEKKVQEMLITGEINEEAMQKYFDADIENGGLGLDKRAAKKIAKKIKLILKEIKLVEKLENNKLGNDSEIQEIERYLLSGENISFTNTKEQKNFRMAIKLRLKNKIDDFRFCKIVDGPESENGAGIDKRKAKKISQKMELLMMGKFK